MVMASELIRMRLKPLLLLLHALGCFAWLGPGPMLMRPRTSTPRMDADADSSLVPPAVVAAALKAEAAQRTQREAERSLPRAEQRARQKATRDLAQSFVSVDVDAKLVCSPCLIDGEQRLTTLTTSAHARRR